MFEKFENYIWDNFSRFGDIGHIVKNMTDVILGLKNKPNMSDMMEISQKDLVPGRFYLIKYDFNGNYIWCPILVLEYKVINNKHILYGLNLEYLPPRYKIQIFNVIFKNYTKELNLNYDINIAKNERPLKFLNFKNIYNMLKSHKMEYAIDAYTIKDIQGQTKIIQSFICSFKISPQFLLADFKHMNKNNMLLKLNNVVEDETKEKLKSIIEQYSKIIEEYQADSLQYHKNVAKFRNKLKIFND